MGKDGQRRQKTSRAGQRREDTSRDGEKREKTSTARQRREETGRDRQRKVGTGRWILRSNTACFLYTTPKPILVLPKCWTKDFVGKPSYINQLHGAVFQKLTAI
jgi:hypothetical protein